ncbi:MAG: hypothetical protein AB7O65_10675 [Candidatus Korobacteraceae bacterium]
MFLGHFAVAMAAKRVAPSVSLGMLVAAAQFLDLLWPGFLLLGIEHAAIAPGITRFTPLDFYDYPYSHSLLMVVGWGIMAGAAYFLLRRRGRLAVVIAALVVSHWVLDFIVHRPDLPLWPGGGWYAGLGLWNSVVGTLLLETAIFVWGVLTYARTRRSNSGARHAWYWVFVSVLFIIYLGSAFGPPPPGMQAVAWVGMAQWLLVLWAWWLDSSRTSIPESRDSLTRS